MLDGKKIEYPRLLNVTSRKLPKPEKPPKSGYRISAIEVDEEDGPITLQGTGHPPRTVGVNVEVFRLRGNFTS